MNGKKWLVLIGAVLVAAPAAYAYTGVQSDQVVTGHTVFNEIVIEINETQVNFKPTDFAAKAGFIQVNDNSTSILQRECVVWFNGVNLDQDPDPAIDDGFNGEDVGSDPENAYPSDEDEAGDPAEQDYDFDGDVPNCNPVVTGPTGIIVTGFVVAVEAGDCEPDDSNDFRFRGSLDFTDPNGVFHEVQEYDYECGTLLGLPDPTLGAGAALSQALFPWSDCHKGGVARSGTGCGTDTPAGEVPLPSNEVNGTLQDLFLERAWITKTHVAFLDPTISKLYNFALQVDTCDGLNSLDLRGQDFGAYNLLYSQLAANGLQPWGSCTDGSSFSFDDGPGRGTVIHSAPPGGTTDVQEGNSWDGTKHRAVCRPGTAATCYPEDHKTALIDIYFYATDPTGGLFALN